ncbi:MAG: hypothetical protein ACI9OO_001665 [Bacteroidia bacterium]|jgi:hypothetical protein
MTIKLDFVGKACCLLLAPLLLQACTLPQQSVNTPRMDVDVADSLNISDFHATKEQTKDSPSNLIGKAEQDERDTEHSARADYQPSQGPAAAYAAIHQELYQTCPAGWTKQQEWTQADDGLFYLYIRANCR